MSTEAIPNLGQKLFGQATATTAHALRLAFGVAGAFVVAEIFGWTLSFLAPVIALQLLAKPGPPPSLVQGIAVVVTIVVSTGITLLLTNLMIGHIMALIVVIGLLLFLTFFAHFRGAPAIVTLLAQISLVALPVLSIAASPLASGFRSILVEAAVVAFIVAWTAHAAFPRTDDEVAAAPDQLPRLEPDEAMRQAGIATLVMLPILIWYLLDATQTAVVLLIVMLSIVRQHELMRGRQAALGQIIGNIGGGLAAILVYQLVVIGDSPVLFAALVILSCLLFADRIVAGDKYAPVYVIAFTTFLILLGLGLSPVAGGSGESFANRIFYVLLGGAYAIAALSLVSLIGSRSEQKTATI